MTSHAPRRHRRLRIVAIVLGTLVALAYLGACGVAGHKLALVFLHAEVADHDGPAAPSRTSLPGLADPAPRPSAPPDVPATWSGTDEQAAADAVAYFAELSTYAMTSGDTARWREVSDPTCESCANLADDIDRLYLTGGRVEGWGMSVTATAVSVTDGVFDVRYRFRTDATFVLASDGSALGFRDPGAGEAVLRVRPAWFRGEPGWAIVDWTAVDPAAPDLLSPDA